jgi:hypothetical protein
VVRAEPFQRTRADGVNPVPMTLRVNAGDPAERELGESELRAKPVPEEALTTNS